MRIIIKLKYLIYIILFGVLSYVFFKVYDFHRYSNNIELKNSIPIFTLDALLNKPIKVKYLKSIYYSQKCIGYNAIVNEINYISVMKIGRVKGKIELLKLKRSLKKSNIIPIPPIDLDEHESKWLNFDNYPYTVEDIQYYLDGIEFNKIEKNGFVEIIFRSKLVNLSLNNSKKTDIIYSNSEEKMSLSFIIYNNELYIISNKPYKNNSFIDLHSL